MTMIRLEPVTWSLKPSLLFGLAGCLAIAACGRGSQPPPRRPRPMAGRP